MNRTDQKLKRIAHLVAEIAETVRDISLQTQTGEVVHVADTSKRYLTDIASEAQQIGGRQGETL